MLPYTTEALNPIILKNTSEEYYLNKGRIEVFHDPGNSFTINTVSEFTFNGFKEPSGEFPGNGAPGTTYWFRFKVKAENNEIPWVLECYNIHADELEFYSRNEDGSFHKNTTGAKLPFTKRELMHINFDFFLSDLTPDKEKIYYIRYVSNNPSVVRFLIHSYSNFTSYALTEYYILGIFYGILIIIFLYNLFLYPRLKDSAYLLYSIYVMFVGLFSMAQDGIGFQYLWPDYPWWNNYSYYTFTTFMVVFMMLYTRSFLETTYNHPLLNKIIIGFIVARISLFLLYITVLPLLSELVWIDLLPFMLAYIASIVAYKNYNKSALYFVIGFSVLFLGFLINTLVLYKLIPATIFTVYCMNVAIIIEMILLSQALSERVRQIREKELMQESLNRALEHKVKERTEALIFQKNIIEEKVKTLDNFIYKASHDIKGPLKSLIGVALLGLKDTPDNAKIYFDHTLKTAAKLDAIVKDLIHITRVNNSPLKLTEINFTELIVEVLEKLSTTPGYEQMKFEIDVNTTTTFYSEKNLLKPVFENIIENAIKFRNQEAKQSKLKIHVKNQGDICEIKFNDNGIGIESEYTGKVFDMFFKIENNSETSTGLGLYIVKLSIEKLGGQINVQSRKGEGSMFSIILKSLQ